MHPLFGQHQALEPGVLRYALTLDVAFALHELQNIGHSGAGDLSFIVVAIVLSSPREVPR